MPKGEQQNHKYIDKITTKDGKIRYIYDPNELKNKRKGVKVLPEDRDHQTGILRPGFNPRINNTRRDSQYILERTQAQSARRNTGNPHANDLPNVASRVVKDGMDYIGSFAGNVMSSAGSAVQSGLSFVQRLFGAK